MAWGNGFADKRLPMRCWLSGMYSVPKVWEQQHTIGQGRGCDVVEAPVLIRTVFIPTIDDHRVVGTLRFERTMSDRFGCVMYVSDDRNRRDAE